MGSLPRPVALVDFAASTKQALGAGAVQVVGAANHPVQHVAIACGAGASFLEDAVSARADVLVTGEARFHDYLAAGAHGIALVLPGHFASERPGVDMLSDHLQRQWPDLTVWASRRERDPVVWQ